VSYSVGHVKVCRGKGVDVMDVDVIDDEALAGGNVKRSANPIYLVMIKVLESVSFFLGGKKCSD
jgi:hypothetical protein